MHRFSFRFLILDPHYTGKDDLKTITDKVNLTEINKYDKK